MHLDRLKSMATSDGQWDLSPNDLAAIRWAIQRSEVADKLKQAVDALMCAQLAWSDNGEQMAHGAGLAREASQHYNRTMMGI